MNFSIHNNGIRACSGSCKYCSSARTENWKMSTKPDVDELIKADEDNYKDYKSDWDKFEELITHNKQWLEEMKKPIENRHMTWELWNTDSGTNLLIAKDVYKHFNLLCDKYEIPSRRLSVSTNGLPFIRDDLCEWYSFHNVNCQLSHDGLGQWIRTGDYNPLDNPNTIELIRNGTLGAINCTHSFLNNDMMANIHYLNQYLKKAWPNIYDDKKVCNQADEYNFKKLYIKLNHIMDGSGCYPFINVNGLFNGKEYEQLKRMPVNNLQLRDDHELAKKYDFLPLGRSLSDYLQSYEQVFLTMERNKYLKITDVGLIPYFNYLNEQTTKRLMEVDTNSPIAGACRNYQRWKHKIGDEKGWSEQTFVLCTDGTKPDYSECNLLDSTTSTLNPGGVQADYCKDCKYKNRFDCNKCGSEKFPDHCEYLYRWNQFLDNIAKQRWLLESVYKKGVNYGYNITPKAEQCKCGK